MSAPEQPDWIGGSAVTSPSIPDKLGVMVHKMTDAEIRAAKEAIIGSPKNTGYRARRLNMGESLALAALMAEEARRVTRLASYPGEEAR